MNKNLPDGAEILSVKEVERYCNPIEITAQWAEYKITPYIKLQEQINDLLLLPTGEGWGEGAKYSFGQFCSDTERVLSQTEILMVKKNKKGLEKTTDIKKSIGAYRFEDGSLFIYLKTGQGSDIPALRADCLLELIAPEQIFEITRLRFLDEKLREL